jgi:hypothetical protein
VAAYAPPENYCEVATLEHSGYLLRQGKEITKCRALMETRLELAGNLSDEYGRKGAVPSGHRLSPYMKTHIAIGCTVVAFVHIHRHIKVIQELARFAGDVGTHIPGICLGK